MGSYGKATARTRKESNTTIQIIILVFAYRFIRGVEFVFYRPFLSLDFFQSMIYLIAIYLIGIRREMKQGLVVGGSMVLFHFLYYSYISFVYGILSGNIFGKYLYLFIGFDIVVLILIFKELNRIKRLDVIEKEPSTD